MMLSLGSCVCVWKYQCSFHQPFLPSTLPFSFSFYMQMTYLHYALSPSRQLSEWAAPLHRSSDNSHSLPRQRPLSHSLANVYFSLPTPSFSPPSLFISLFLSIHSFVQNIRSYYGLSLITLPCNVSSFAF